MQGTKDQVAGFGTGKRQANGFQIAHFADQNNVRVLAQRRAQRVGKRQRVRTDFALVDQALLGFVHELDRILDGQNVSMIVLVDMIDHRRQCRRFARTGRTGNQHDATRILGNILEYFRAIQIFERQHLGRNGPENRCGATILDEGINPEARQIGDFEREIALQILFVVLALPVVHDVIDH